MASLTLSEQSELELLCEFYDCWKAFHACPKDILHRPKLQRAAQRMVDAADSVERFRSSLVEEPAVVQ